MLGLTCGHFEITVLTRQRHSCGLTKSCEDKCRRLTCPIKEKMDLTMKSKDRGFLNHLEVALMIAQHAVVMCRGERDVS